MSHLFIKRVSFYYHDFNTGLPICEQCYEPNTLQNEESNIKYLQSVIRMQHNGKSKYLLVYCSKCNIRLEVKKSY